MSQPKSKPAFPQQQFCDFGHPKEQEGDACGMSLRDYFAAKAMAAFIEATSDHSGHHPQIDERVAERAYEMADSMLEARAACN